MKNQPIQINPNDLPKDQKLEDLKQLEKGKEIKESSTTGQPEEQEESTTKQINPFRND